MSIKKNGHLRPDVSFKSAGMTYFKKNKATERGEDQSSDPGATPLARPIGLLGGTWRYTASILRLEMETMVWLDTGRDLLQRARRLKYAVPRARR